MSDFENPNETLNENPDIEVQEELLEELTDLEAAGENDIIVELGDVAEPEEFLTDEQLQGALEALLFSTDKPVSVAVMKSALRGTNVRSNKIRRALELLQMEYADPRRGVALEEINGGYQLRTKMDYMPFLKQTVKTKAFKLSGPALEVLSIVAYKQPCIKAEIDQVRGVESGHLVRGLMEKNILCFAGKSDFPGKPMLYATTRRFLEIFGLRNIKELPSLGEIDELIPEGIGDLHEKEEKLGDITDSMSQEAATTYSEGQEELDKIADTLSDINTSTDFFEDEKRRVKEQKERERAQDIRDALAVDEEVEAKDVRWLERYDAKIAEEMAAENLATEEPQVEIVDAEVLEAEAAETEVPMGEALEAVVADVNFATVEAGEEELAFVAEGEVAQDLSAITDQVSGDTPVEDQVTIEDEPTNDFEAAEQDDVIEEPVRASVGDLVSAAGRQLADFDSDDDDDGEINQ